MHRAALALAITLLHVNVAAPPDGSHRYVLHHFCVVLNALQYTPKPNTNWADVKNIMDASSTINLLLNSRDAVEKTAAEEESAQPPTKEGQTQESNPCGGDKRASCIPAKKFLDAYKGDAKKHLIAPLATKSYVTLALNKTGRQVETKEKELAAKEGKDVFSQMKATLKQAPFGGQQDIVNNKNIRLGQLKTNGLRQSLDTDSSNQRATEIGSSDALHMHIRQNDTAQQSVRRRRERSRNVQQSRYKRRKSL
uniref:Variant surface glycoprotein 1922 n=1 Tax=Trypanosoma brucei TaxID=5691 RepID=M4T1C2_9TRYP|nr:variant surface glycoprotein 1922 [Trypanosoma brucei]